MAVPPDDTIKVTPLLTVGLLRVAPEMSASVPPLLTVKPLITPPLNTISPPFNTMTAPPADTVTRGQCDTEIDIDSNLRMCWHDGISGAPTGELYGGYRCGATVGLNSSTAWERVVYQAD